MRAITNEPHSKPYIPNMLPWYPQPMPFSRNRMCKSKPNSDNRATQARPRHLLRILGVFQDDVLTETKTYNTRSHQADADVNGMKVHINACPINRIIVQGSPTVRMDLFSRDSYGAICIGAIFGQSTRRLGTVGEDIGS